MGKGRKASALPDCELSYLHSTATSYLSINSVVEISDDLKGFDAKSVKHYVDKDLAAAAVGGYRKKGLAYHLKSDIHAQSISAQQIRKSIQEAGMHSMQEESAIEAQMDFVMLPPSTSNVPAATAMPQISLPSQEEQEMWRNYEIFWQHSV